MTTPSSNPVAILLIEPFGIEIVLFFVYVDIDPLLLIEPFGIEIRSSLCRYVLRQSF